MSFAGLGLGFGDTPHTLADGAELDVRTAFDGWRLAWPQPDGSVIFVDDMEGRALIFKTTDAARAFAKIAQTACSKIGVLS